MIDLRSDTCSRPTEAMRKAMAAAEVGDDVYHDDPTVRALEERVAEVLGKEEAVYMVTGTMTNQIGLRTHTEAGDQVVMEATAHMFILEGGAPAALSGVTVRPIQGRSGIFTADQLEAAIPRRHPFMPEVAQQPFKLVCLENTHNVAGGVVWPLEQIEAVTTTARRLGLATHLDGARIWNAVAKTGIPASTYAAPFDTVSVCFSKGLGAPVGSALAGRQALIKRARRFKQALGGGFRQAGIIAAGALHGLEHHRERLVEDHDHATRFAEGLAELAGITIDLTTVQTNIVRFRVTRMPAGTFTERCHAAGVHMVPTGVDQVRAVFHLDISSSDLETALVAIRGVLAGETE